MALVEWWRQVAAQIAVEALAQTAAETERRLMRGVAAGKVNVVEDKRSLADLHKHPKNPSIRFLARHHLSFPINKSRR